jgi:hypothetical protein
MLFWRSRNPFHNLMFYVVGCADRRFKLIGENTNWREPNGLHAHLILQFWPPWFCPYVSYRSPGGFEIYLGWRHDGALGARPGWVPLVLLAAVIIWVTW